MIVLLVSIRLSVCRAVNYPQLSVWLSGTLSGREWDVMFHKPIGSIDLHLGIDVDGVLEFRDNRLLEEIRRIAELYDGIRRRQSGWAEYGTRPVE